MAGLTLGLMSLGLVDLEVLIKSGRPQDRKHAAKIYPVVKNQHLLLCTLLIGNSLAMESLPIFLDKLLPPWAAILLSVTLILMFAEIMPQAICTRYGLTVEAAVAPLVQLLLWLFFPIAYPISKVLDWMLGKGHAALLRRAELKTDVSYDFPQVPHSDSHCRARRLPSGCIIQDMLNGHSKITWIEHVEIEDIRPIHNLYRENIYSGLEFGATRRLATLQRTCERLTRLINAVNSASDLGEGKFLQHCFLMEDGVVHVYANRDAKEKLYPVVDATTFFTDLHHILKVIAAGNIRTLCYHRLVLLEHKFNLHLMLNADREFLAQKSAPHRDFYNVRKVDTHVHHSACMNQKHLLRFIKSKLRKEPGEVVIFRDGTYLTLKEGHLLIQTNISPQAGFP